MRKNMVAEFTNERIISSGGLAVYGQTFFGAIHEMDDDPDFYKDALGICYAVPTAETLRQRFDLIGISGSYILMTLGMQNIAKSGSNIKRWLL